VRVRQTFDFDWFKVRWLPKYGWVMDRAPAVLVIPIAPDGRIWLAQVERVPTGTTSWELPGGQIGHKEDVVAAALRELDEECALIAKGASRLVPTVLELAPGMGRFPHYAVIAHDVVPKGRKPVAQREEGVVAVRRFDRQGVRGMLQRGHISVYGTLATLAISGWLDPPAAVSRGKSGSVVRAELNGNAKPAAKPRARPAR
jgi:8-oxo-dGTP pyrophosphatase MutT (NUDIX family)